MSDLSIDCLMNYKNSGLMKLSGCVYPYTVYSARIYREKYERQNPQLLCPPD